jgi:methylase of polypeptide subunit release factors
MIVLVRLLLASSLLITLIYGFIDLQHHLFRLTMEEKLYLSPIKGDVQNVLDVGTGTGVWAIDFGLCY